MKRLFLLLVFLSAAASAEMRAPDAAQFVGPPKGAPVSGAALDGRAHTLATMLRCLVCQGRSIADSPAEMAVNMRGQVRELLARGFTDQQILDYFEHSYGQFVLLKPKFRGLTSLVWTLPLFVLLLGAAVVFVKLRRMERAPLPLTAPAPDPSDVYLARVRQMVKQ
jgi:cytochrome c-type biogenesis protein CcmH